MNKDNEIIKQKNLITIYKSYIKWMNNETKFIKLLLVKKNKDLQTAYYDIIYNRNDWETENKFIVTLTNNLKIRKGFIEVHKLFLAFILKTRKLGDVKPINNYNFDKYILLVRRKNHNYESLKELIIEFTMIKKKLRYFISIFFISSALFFKIPNVRYKYYYKSKKEDILMKCETKKCKNNTEEENNKIFANFIKAKMAIKKVSKISRDIAIHRFINSLAFKNYYECFYNNCNRNYLSFIRSKVNYYYAIESLHNPILKNRYKKELANLKESLKYSNIKTFKDFLFTIGKYWKLVFKLNIYI